MEHFYNNENIQGWFGYEQLYLDAVVRASDHAHFVEVGVWQGKSACYMAVEIINSGKKIKFDCVDTWDFVETSKEFSKEQFNGLYDKFLNNIKPVREHINVVRSLSWEAANNYTDNSLDFVFIDAAHDYDSVTKDIFAWYPKIKIGGTIAGHDYAPGVGVYDAVNDFFKTNVIDSGACWIHYK